MHCIPEKTLTRDIGTPIILTVRWHITCGSCNKGGWCNVDILGGQSSYVHHNSEALDTHTF